MMIVWEVERAVENKVWGSPRPISHLPWLPPGRVSAVQAGGQSVLEKGSIGHSAQGELHTRGTEAALDKGGSW